MKRCMFVMLAVLIAVAAAQDSLNCRLVGSCDTPGSACGVAVSGNHAFVADGPPPNGLRVIDVTNPENPTEVGYCPLPEQPTSNLAVSANYAYVTNGFAGLRIIDISDPANPQERGFFDTPAIAYDVAVAGSYAYVGDGTCLRVINIANPADPTEAGYFVTPDLAYGVAVSGSYAYVAASRSGLRIIDVSDPQNPTEVGNCDTRAAMDVVVSGNYAYVADGDSGLRVIDVSNPRNPTEAGHYYGGMYVTVIRLAVSGNLAYLGAGDAGLRVINVSDPQNPTEVGYYDMTRVTSGVALSGTYAYAADGDPGLGIYQYTGGGVEDSYKLQAAGCKPTATIVGGVLSLGAGSKQQTACGADLLDAAGRRAMTLKVGPNDVSHLAPGVYFVVEPRTGNQEPRTATKLVIAR